MINLGLLTEGKLADILITPSSWGSQRASYLLHQLGTIIPPHGGEQGGGVGEGGELARGDSVSDSSSDLPPATRCRSCFFGFSCFSAISFRERPWDPLYSLF
jgi:hypothetical protein